MNTITAFVQRHPLVAFFGLTFVISWAIWIARIAASLGIGSAGGGALNAIAIAANPDHKRSIAT